jgi:hypothetical protein
MSDTLDKAYWAAKHVVDSVNALTDLAQVFIVPACWETCAKCVIARTMYSRKSADLMLTRRIFTSRLQPSGYAVLLADLPSWMHPHSRPKQS